MPNRAAAVAGQFYPAAPDKLRSVVARCLADAETAPAPECVTAIVAPHAGYPYSGPTAGCAFRRIQGMAPRRVVLLGPSHHYRFRGFSLYTEGAFDTPLGAVPVDGDFMAKLAGQFPNTCPEAHVPEHALEVELPFLQTVLAPGFMIVPVLFGDYPTPEHHALAESLAEHLAPGDLILASTDLSHFLTETEAHQIDRHSLDTVLAGDPEALTTGLRDGSYALCGGTAVVVALAAANLLSARSRTEWDYRTSAWATGDPSRVVGYGGLTLERAG
ncbi:MAG: AmmeMemoRadiSam system protein B [Candidatus Hydrogenedentes bacterium]|nr:AmmeMemoRadiSam system protein B [Candidatus Hydrogenedentota bacterium]